MTTLHPQFIINQAGEKVSVVLPLSEYNKLLEEAEDQNDLQQYVAAKKGPLEFIDAHSAFAELDKSRSKK